MAKPRPISWNTADVVAVDTDGKPLLDGGSPVLRLDGVRFFVRTDSAYALDKRGHRLWEATITDVERRTKDLVVLTLADGPTVTARKYCRPCTGRA